MNTPSGTRSGATLEIAGPALALMATFFAVEGVARVLVVVEETMEIVPLEPPPATADAVGFDRITAEMLTGIELVEGWVATCTVANASVPSLIVVEFIPYTRQVFPEQVTDLLAFRAVGATATLTDVMSEV